MPHAGEEDEIYDDAPPPRRRIGIMAIAAVFALAVIGTAGAFGYRAMFGSSGANLPPPVIKADTAPSKSRAGEHGQDSEQVDYRPADRSRAGRKAGLARRTTGRDDEHSARRGRCRRRKTARRSPPIRRHSVAASFPASRRRSTPSPSIPIRPAWVIASRRRRRRRRGADRQAPSPVRPIAPPSRAANNAPPVADNPEPPPAPRQTEARAAPPERQAARDAARQRAAFAEPGCGPRAARTAMRTAAAAAPAPAASQPAAAAAAAAMCSCRRSAAKPTRRAAFRGLQAKYPSQLGNRQPVIRKVELGAKGTYYRAMVGPLAGNEASGALHRPQGGRRAVPYPAKLTRRCLNLRQARANPRRWRHAHSSPD